MQQQQDQQPQQNTVFSNPSSSALTYQQFKSGIAGVGAGTDLSKSNATTVNAAPTSTPAGNKVIYKSQAQNNAQYYSVSSVDTLTSLPYGVVNSNSKVNLSAGMLGGGTTVGGGGGAATAASRVLNNNNNASNSTSNGSSKKLVI